MGRAAPPSSGTLSHPGLRFQLGVEGLTFCAFTQDLVCGFAIERSLIAMALGMGVSLTILRWRLRSAEVSS